MPDAQALQKFALEAGVRASVEKIDHEPDAASRHHEDQGRDDRLDVEHRNEETVPQATEKSRPERNEQDDEMRVARVDAPCDDGADDGDDRADREVDALRADDDGHAESDDCGRRSPVEDVDEIAEQAPLDDADVEESGRNHSIYGEDERERDERPDGAMSSDSAQAAVRRGRRLDFHGRVHVRAPAMVSMMAARVMSVPAISPILRRSRRTAIRSLTATSSSSSEEATSSARPCCESLRMSETISACAPTSMPRVGSSRMRTRGFETKARAKSTFC